MKQYTIASTAGKIILGATILASAISFLDGSVINIAIPAIQSQFNASLSDIQWVVNSYTLMLSALTLIAGSLSDRFGRKRIFTMGIGICIVSSVLCSIAQSVLQLSLFRVLLGVGGAMMVPGSLAIISNSFAETVRNRAIGLWSGFSGGVAALGPFVGGWLVETFGWPSIFYINIPLGLIALIASIKYVPESKNDEATRVDVVGSVLIFLSLLALTYGLISGSDMGWTNPLILANLVGGVVLFILFVYVQTRVREPLVPLEIFKSPLVTGANIATFFLYFALYGVFFFLTLNLQQIQHFTPIQAGLAMLPAIVLITFLSGPGGTLADKMGPRMPMIVGPLIVALGMGLMALPGRNVNYWMYIFPGLTLLGLGMSAVIAPLTNSALAVDKKYSGAASGVNNANASIAALLAIALLGILVLNIFQNKLQAAISVASLTGAQRQQILDQQNKLGGIEIPADFDETSKTTAQIVIEDSFVYGYRWAMWINVVLAVLSGGVAYFTIFNPQKK